MSNTSASGGFMIPASGMSRADIERLLCALVSGVTGLSPSLVRRRFEPEPHNRPVRDVTWCALGITERSEPASEVRHRETADGAGESVVITQETLSVLFSFVGPEAEDMALRFKAALCVAQNRETLYHANMALIDAGTVTTLPELDGMRFVLRADVPVRFRRASASAEGVVSIRHMAQPDITFYQ